MNPIVFYLGAGALTGLSVKLFKETSPYSRTGGSEYEKRRSRRLAGKLLLVAAAFSLGIGLLAQLSASNR